MPDRKTQQPGAAQRIREYIRTAYVEPARLRHDTLVTLRAGDIHRALGLRNRVPNVCQVMESRLLEREAGLKISSRQGPPSGRGTTLTVTYAVEQPKAAAPLEDKDPSPETRNHHGFKRLLALRGKGKETYASAGGGEKWLAAERAQFYKPGKDPAL